MPARSTEPSSRAAAIRQAALPKRLSLSDIAWLLLTKPARDHSAVTLSRNAKGETQIEVVVRTGDTDEIATPYDAERVAKAIYDRLRSTYPMSSGLVGAAPQTPEAADAEHAARKRGGAGVDKKGE